MAVGLIARDDESAEFFDATSENTLVIQQCTKCSHLQYPLPFAPSTARCRNCSHTDLSWQPVSGEGHLISWTHLHRKPNNDGTPAPVTTVAIIELNEGPWIHTQLSAVPESLHAGDRMHVTFDRAEGGEAIPLFQPAATV